MNLRAALLLSVLAAIAAAPACTRTPSADAGTDAAAAGAAPADACDALRKRVAACLANVRRGSLQLEFDPATMTDPQQCRQTNEKFTLLANVVQCEGAAPAAP